MKFKNFLLLLSLVANFTFAQNNIKVTYNYGSENKDIQNLIDFENIYFEQLNFEGKDLIGKQYLINLQEFKNGKLISKSVLFDGEGNDHFKIKSEKESLKFLFKMTDGKLKTYIRGSGFGSKKSYFNLKDDSDQYALKDFFGNKKELDLVANQETAVFAILTPTKHDDGSSSYCEVVQSDIKPENLGTYFKIPHYFLVTLQFK